MVRAGPLRVVNRPLAVIAAKRTVSVVRRMTEKGRLATFAMVSTWAKRELDSVVLAVSYQDLR